MIIFGEKYDQYRVEIRVVFLTNQLLMVVITSSVRKIFGETVALSLL
jgi:citrate lyase gamma subunit